VNPKTIIIITGEHPYKCTGGSEMQAYLIAKGLSAYYRKTIFCTVFSKETCIEFETDNFVHLSLKNGFLPWKILRFLIFMRELKPDVFYVRCLYSFWWLKLVSKWYKKPIIYHLSSDGQTFYKKLDHNSLLSSLFHNFYVWTIQFSSKIIAQTKVQAELYKKTFNILPNIVYNAQPIVTNGVQKNYSKIYIIWIGKGFKNPEKFTALAINMRNSELFEFIIAGIFTARQISSFEDIQKYTTNFRYLGEISRTEVFRQLDNAHVLINTSLMEGFPNTFIEAWLRGVIVISDKINPDNILTEKGIGFVCNGINEIESKLYELFSGDLTLAKDYSAKAKEYAFKNHNINEASGKIFQIIQGLYQS